MKPIWKWIVGIAAGLIIISLVSAWYLGRRLQPTIETKLKEAVIHETDSLYQITYDTLDFSLISGNASLRNLRLTMDTAVYSRMEREQRAPDDTYEIHAAHLRIRGLSLLKMLISKSLDIHTIVIDTTSVSLTNRYHPYNDTLAKDSDSRSLYQRISKVLKKVNVNRIQLNSGRFEYAKETDATRLVVQHADIAIRDVLIDSLSQFDTSRFYHARTIQLDVPGVEFIRPDSLYSLRVDHLQAATDTRQLLIHGLTYASLVSMTEFYRQKKVAKDMAAISVSSIRLADIDLQRWVDTQTIAAGTMHIDSGTISIVKDLLYPKLVENKIGKSPHQHLLNLKQPLAIDSVLLNGLDISFAEISEKYRKGGKVTFDRTSGIIRNLTNDSLSLAQDSMMVLDVTTQVMNAGKLSVVFKFDLLDKAGAHTYTVKLGAMDGRAFNRMLSPLMNAEVASADMQGLSFNMNANDYRTSGTLQFDYRNLKLNVLTSNDEGEKSAKKVVSFLVNRFLINDSNPDANGVYHSANIDFERPPTYSFFKMIWQTLFEGMKQCMGMSKQGEERLLNAADGEG
ncbi:hypothetical protein [Parapedobacter tibetensis]|uniref:hypothetical protein n=1 Tax=Parapedobacter tibetensis TaxID=2972951 RepID=UPI00214D8758|nr:hypothetical protein [Parapedobacter tibetensis]